VSGFGDLLSPFLVLKGMHFFITHTSPLRFRVRIGLCACTNDTRLSTNVKNKMYLPCIDISARIHLLQPGPLVCG